MPLTLDLKPYERLIINGAAIRNGDRRTKLCVETHCRFLRESELIQETDADTPSKRLWFLLQVLYLAEDRSELETKFRARAAELITAAPSVSPYIVSIYEELASGQYHRAIKQAKALVEYEATLLESCLRDAA